MDADAERHAAMAAVVERARSIVDAYAAGLRGDDLAPVHESLCLALAALDDPG